MIRAIVISAIAAAAWVALDAHISQHASFDQRWAPAAKLPAAMPAETFFKARELAGRPSFCAYATWFQNHNPTWCRLT